MLSIRNIIGLFLLLFTCSLFANMPLAIPEALVPWKGWVLKGYESQLCPGPYNNGEQHFCIWPTELNLILDAQKGKFSQKTTTYIEGWVSLPGEPRYWPQDITVNGKPFPVLTHEGMPALFLMPGEYKIEGNFTYDNLPEYIQTPFNAGLLTLKIQGKEIIQPERESNGKVWLRTNTQVSQTQEADALNIKVFRLLEDQIPIVDNTVLRLQVSGSIREVSIGPVLQPHTVPLDIISALPARLETSGMLSLQLKPGVWEIHIKSRFQNPVNQFTYIKQPLPWPKEEIWSFSPQNALRLVDIKGGISMDPEQTDLPMEWRQYPAYLMQEGGSIELVEKRRGEEKRKAQELRLSRKMWLDFSGKGFTVQDVLTGQIEQHPRLSMLPPYLLGRVSVNGQDKLITQMGDENVPGVEIRQGNLHLDAVSRVLTKNFTLPAIGWDVDVKSLTTTLMLPPGWMLLGGWGADLVTHAWIQSWNLLDFFLVLIIAVATFKLFGLRWGVVALLTLVLIYQENNAPIYSWVNLIGIIALLRVLPAGRAKQWGEYYFKASALVLILIALPFMVQQIREAIYPQLGTPQSFYGVDGWQQNNMRQRGFTISAAPQAAMEGSIASVQKMDTLMSGGAFEQKAPAKPLEDYDPNAKTQTGPGVPTWQWNSFALNWNGPVLQNQKITLLLVPRWGTALMKWGEVILMCLFIYALLGRRKSQQNVQTPPSGTPSGTQTRIQTPRTAWMVGVCFLFAGLFFGIPNTAYADFPDTELLDELRDRLIEPQRCLPECADITQMQVEASLNQLTLRFKAQIAAPTAIPLPGTFNKWMPRTVMVNQVPAQNILKDDNQQLWLQLDQGVHEVVLEAPIGEQDSFDIYIPLKPKVVIFQSNDWEVGGILRAQLQGQNLHFTRLKSEQSTAATQNATDAFKTVRIPPFVTLTRTLRLGLDWEIVNEVQRIAPLRGAIQLHIPLLKNEAPLTEGVESQNGQVLISLSESQNSFSWNSKLDISPAIDLTAVQDPSIKEIWQLNAITLWHCAFTGIPLIHQFNRTDQWTPTWQPWPGEKVQIAVSKPEAMLGQSLTIDNSRIVVEPGKQQTTNILDFTARTTQGGNFQFQIPEAAQLQDILINGQSQPINLQAGEISVPLHPGSQQVQIKWQMPEGIKPFFKTPKVDLHVPNTNAVTHLTLMQNRWILLLGGPALGPAVLFWGILVVMILIAVALGKSKLTPLKSWEWLLLGLGLTVATPVAAIVVVAWFVLMQQRRKMISPLSNLSSGSFKGMQIGLVLLSGMFVVSLFTSISAGLLGLPQMQIASPHLPMLQNLVTGTQYQLEWYQDQMASTLPQAWCISLPLYIYRIAMLLWALWLAFSLVKWLRWGWESYAMGEYWPHDKKID